MGVAQGLSGGASGKAAGAAMAWVCTVATRTVRDAVSGLVSHTVGCGSFTAAGWAGDKCC
jgi:hypothetical protein